MRRDSAVGAVAAREIEKEYNGKVKAFFFHYHGLSCFSIQSICWIRIAEKGQEQLERVLITMLGWYGRETASTQATRAKKRRGRQDSIRTTHTDDFQERESHTQPSSFVQAVWCHCYVNSTSLILRLEFLERSRCCWR